MIETLRNSLRQAEEQRQQLELELAACKDTERQLAEQAERFRTTLASIADAVIATDLEARITCMNAVAETLTGWTTADAMGKRLDAVVRMVNETTRATVESPLTRVLEEGDIVGLAYRTFLIAKEGAERPIDGSAAPIRRTDGQVVGCVLVFRDITERHRVEATQREAQAEVVTTLESITDGFMRFDRDWRVMYVNAEAERINQRSRSDTLGKTLWELWPAAAGTTLETEYRRAVAGHLTVEFENYFEPWDRWYAIKGYPAVDGGLTIYFRDITTSKVADAALRERTAILKAVTEGSPDPIFVKDVNGRMVFANGATLRVLGRSEKEVLGRTDADWHGRADEAEALMANDRRIMGSGVSETVEETVTGPNGTGTYLSTKTPMRDAAGAVIGIIGVTRDITERKRTEEALRESEAKYRSLFENMLDGFAYCQMLFDEQGQPHDFVYLAVNDTFGRLTGLENVTGKRVSQVIPGIKERHPEVFEIYGRVASTGNPERFEIDFKPLGVRLSISVSCPATGYFVAVFDDVTLRAQTEEVLRESEERFRLMADGLPVMIWVHDAHGQLQFVNHTYCQYFGVTPQQVAGPNWQPLVHSDDVAAYASEFSACVRDRRPFHAEVRVRRFDGEWRWLESRAQPRFSASGEFLGMVGSSPDITDRKAATNELQQLAAVLSEANLRKDEFMATLAHELRNPLAPIRNGLSILQMAHSLDQVKQVVVMMDRQLGHLVHLVDDLLDLSRVRTGKVTLRSERVTVREAVDAAVESCRPLIDEKSHTLAVDLPAEVLAVTGDKTRLMQVVANLLTNAAKYSEMGGRIRVTAVREGGEAVIRVSDTGMGIAPDLLPTLWDLFTQVRDTLDKAQGGLGIGLSLVKQLVELHGGTVAAESAGVGHGSTFTVRLPLAATVDQTAASSVTTDGWAPARPAGRRVLVVDDNVDAAESLAMLLQISGHTTATAHSGPAALETARAFAPEIVFLDIGLPAGMDGYEVARRLRADPEMATTVLVALTGWGSESDKRTSQEAGFDGHLTKPVEADTVRALIARFSSMSATARERERIAVIDNT